MEPFRTWIDLLFPRACAACGGPGAAPICESCRARISVRPAEGCCRVCGKTLVARDDALGTAEPASLPRLDRLWAQVVGAAAPATPSPA